MTCKILYGQPVRDEILRKAKYNGVKGASLTIFQVGNNDASNVYVRNKTRVCAMAGVDVNVRHIKQNVLPPVFGSKVISTKGGILVQLPTGRKELDSIVNVIPYAQDVDCLSYVNYQNMLTAKKDATLMPCTVRGIIEMLSYYNIDVAGKGVTIVGRSKLVGEPLSVILSSMDATVTLCHSHTYNLSTYTKLADIVICAVGQPKLITGDMIKEGAVLIDVGINRDENNKLCGDISFDSCKDKAYAISPVPKGVGLTTTASVVYNLSVLQEGRI